MASWSSKRSSNSFTFIGLTVMFLQFVWESRCLALLRWKWSRCRSIFFTKRVTQITHSSGHTGIGLVNQSIKEHNQLVTSWWIMIMNNTVRDRCSTYVKNAIIVPIVGVVFLWNVMPRHCTAKWFLFVSSVYLWSRPTCKKVLVAQHKLSGKLETLKLVKYLWAEIRNLDGI